MVCETCWTIAANRAYGRGGVAADYYSAVLKEREGVCPESIPVTCPHRRDPAWPIDSGDLDAHTDCNCTERWYNE